MSSCSQARSLSPTHAAIIARYIDHRQGLVRILFHRKKFDRAAAFTQRSSFRPRAASISPSAQKAAQNLAGPE